METSGWYGKKAGTTRKDNPKTNKMKATSSAATKKMKATSRSAATKQPPNTVVKCADVDEHQSKRRKK